MKQWISAFLVFFITTFTVSAQIVVNTTEDSIKNDTLTSLREAILLANNETGNTVITFDSQVFTDTTVTIYLDSALPEITKSNLTLQGINKYTAIRSNTGNDTGLVVSADAFTLKNMLIGGFSYYNSDSGYYNYCPAVLFKTGNNALIDGSYFVDNYDGVVFENFTNNVQVTNSSFSNNAYGVSFESGAETVTIGPNNHIMQYYYYYYTNITAFWFGDSTANLSITGNTFRGTFSDLGGEASVLNPNPADRLNKSRSIPFTEKSTQKTQKMYSKERLTKLSKKQNESRINPLPYFEESEYSKTSKSYRASKTQSGISEINYSQFLCFLINKGWNIDISGNTFRGTYTSGMIVDNRDTTDNKLNSNIMIKNNKLTDVYQGFIISKAKDIQVSHNTFDFIYEQILYSEYNTSLEFSDNNSNLHFHDYYGVYAVRSVNDSSVTLAGNSVGGFDYFYYADYTKNVTAENNLLGRMYDNAFYLYASENLTIKNNSVKYSDDDFIYTNNSKDINVTGNFINYTYGSTIYSYRDKNVYVGYNRGNYIDYGVAGWFDYDTTAVSEFNSSTWVDCEPIGVEYSQDIEIRNHSFSNTWCEFAWIYRSDNVRLHHNKLESSEDDNICVYEVTNMKIFNNLISNAYYSNNIYIREYYYETAFPPVDSLLIANNILIGAEYDGIYYYDYSAYYNSIAPIRTVLIENNIIANGGVTSSGFNFYGYRHPTDSTSIKMTIRNNDISKFNTGISISGYMKRNIDELSFTNNNFTDLLEDGIRFNNWNYGNGFDSLMIFAQGNFWGDPSGPFVPDTSYDILRIANPDGKGFRTDSWVDWRNYKMSPDSPFNGKVMVTSVMPKEFNHTDSLLVRLDGYDFSHVNEVFIGKTPVMIISKSANEMLVLAKNVRPGYNHVKFVGNGILDSIPKVFYVRNLNPPLTALVYPLTNSNNVDTRPVFVWNAVTDPDGDQVHYQITVYSDAAMTQKIYSANTVQPQFQHEGYDLTVGETYYWNVITADIFGWHNPQTQKGQFSVSAVNSVNDSAVPDQFGLSQNYPNPFNPVTTIAYQIKETGSVKFTVWNVLGQVVFEQSLGVVNPGYQSLTFNSAALSSGVYLYGIEVSGDGTTKFRSVKQMTLLK